MPSCIHVAIEGIKRRKVLRSWLRTWNFEIETGIVSVSPDATDCSSIIVTDSYEGLYSDGLFDGSEIVALDRVRGLLQSGLKMGQTIYFLRNIIPKTSQNLQFTPQCFPWSEEVLLFSEKVEIGTVLPINTLTKITERRAEARKP
jgi:hypothetical protein